MDHHPERWGQSRTDHLLKCMQPSTRTLNPTVTGTSVIALKYKGGVMMAADCLASYGSLARFRDVERIHALGDSCLIGVSGDYSDYQFTKQLLDSYMIEEVCHDDGHYMNPKQWHTALQAYLYGRRGEGNPLWTANVIAGVDQPTQTPFLGVVDKLGNAWEACTVATGYGAYLAQPLLRSATQEGSVLLSEEQAVALLEQCMRVLYLRDARASDKIQLAKVSVEEGAVRLQISKPYQVQSDWSIAH